MLGLKYKNEDRILEERESCGVPYLSFPALEQTSLVNHGFSTRLGGVSKGCWSTMNISTTRGDDPAAIREYEEDRTGHRGTPGKHGVYSSDAHDQCGCCGGKGQGEAFSGDRRPCVQYAGDMPCDVLCGLRSAVLS